MKGYLISSQYCLDNQVFIKISIKPVLIWNLIYNCGLKSNYLTAALKVILNFSGLKHKEWPDWIMESALKGYRNFTETAVILGSTRTIELLEMLGSEAHWNCIDTTLKLLWRWT